MIHKYHLNVFIILYICLGSEEAQRKPQDVAPAKAGRRRQTQKVGEYWSGEKMFPNVIFDFYKNKWKGH